MSILSGYKKMKDYVLTSTGYQKLSRWTSSNTVEFNDGATAEQKVGSINGMVTTLDGITSATNTSVAASATSVLEAYKTLNSKMGTQVTMTLTGTTLNITTK